MRHSRAPGRLRTHALWAELLESRIGLTRPGLAELRERQDAITAARRDELIGARVEVLVDAPGTARSHREAPEIDGVVAVPDHLPVGTFQVVAITGAMGPDLEAAPVGAS